MSVARFLLALALLVSSAVGLTKAAGPPAVIVADTTTFSLFENEPAGLIVFVYDAEDNPVPSPQVRWQGPTAGPRAQIIPYETGMEEEGAAGVILIAKGGLGTYELTASIDGGPSTTFTVSNHAKPLRIVSGSVQSTLINTPYPSPLVVEARTLEGAPISGAPINFAARTFGASATLESSSVVTDVNGRASITLIANGTTGSHSVSINAPTVPFADTQFADFTNINAVPATIVASGGNGEELPIGGSVRELVALVRDSAGLPARNVAVTFQGPLTGPGLEMIQAENEIFLIPGGAKVFSGTDGRARIYVSANQEAGSYQVTATTDGIATPATFSISNVARQIAAIRPNNRAPEEFAGEEAPINGRYDRIRFRVIDSEGFGVAGVTLTLTPPSSGPSLTLDSTTIVTGPDGFAETGGTANGEAGNFGLRAEAPGAPAPVQMLMQNYPPGYRVGDQLADINASDQTGTLQSLRAFTNDGRYLLIDVCTMWCSVCRFVQADGQQMKSQLAAMGIDVAVVPMVVDSINPGEPSTLADALNWHAEFGITDPVLHASGNASSPVVAAGTFFLGADRPGFPTFILVGPGGEILARHRGAFNDAQDMVEFVLAEVPSDVSIGSATVSESAGAVSVTVTRSSAHQFASVSFATSPGTAGITDFSSRSGELTFAAGQTTAIITVPIINDTIDEPNEQFSIALTDASNARIVNGTGMITIVDDDAAPVVSIGDQRFIEGTGTITKVGLPIRLDRPSAVDVIAGYAMIAGTAKSTDVLLAKGEVRIAAGRTSDVIPIEIVADKSIEQKETFTVRLLGASQATLGVSEATVSIVDDDRDTDAPIMDTIGDVIVEVKMASSGLAVVEYKEPSAIDKFDGQVAVTCTPPSGGKYPYGTTPASCSAEDRAGNLAVRNFNIIVRLPTVAGAIFAPGDPSTPITQAARGDRILVHVNAGAFVPGATVVIAFVDEKDKRRELGRATAAGDGSLDRVVELHPGTTVGAGYVLAHSDAAGGEYDRAWLLEVTKKGKD